MECSITVAAAEKGQAQQADFDRLLSLLSKSSFEGTQLMSWKQTISTGKQRMRDHNATDGDLYIAYALLKAAQQWPKQAKDHQAKPKGF